MHLRRLRCSLCVVWLVALLPWTLARADERHVWFQWQRPPASMCPGRAALEADVEDLLGRPVFARESEAELLVRGSVRETSEGAYAVLDAQLADGTPVGRRELVAPAGECASLRQALALVLTLFAEEGEGARASRTDPWTTPGRPLWGLTTGLLFGPMPRAEGGLGALLAVELARGLRGRLDASYFLPRSIQTRIGQGARLEAAALGIRICPRLVAAARFTFRGCAGSELGGWFASPKELSATAHRTRLFAQGVVELEVEARVLPRLALTISLGPTLPFARPQFYARTADDKSLTVFRPGLLGAFLRMGVIIAPR
jgi:hypothetical protein